MEARLIIVGGKADKTEVSVKLPAIVGRSREADLTVAHPMVSRQHCELYEQNGVLMIRDLGSLNGTFVRNQRITEGVPLRPNDEFTIGPLTLRAQYDYAGEIALPPPLEPQVAGQPETQPIPDLFTAADQPAAAQAPAIQQSPVAGQTDEVFVEGLPDFAAWASHDVGDDVETPLPAEPAEDAGQTPASAPAQAFEAGEAVEPSAQWAGQTGDQVEYPEFALQLEQAPGLPPGTAQPDSPSLDGLPGSEVASPPPIPAERPNAARALPPGQTPSSDEPDEDLDEFLKELL